jgi:hypothetical protein
VPARITLGRLHDVIQIVMVRTKKYRSLIRKNCHCSLPMDVERLKRGGNLTDEFFERPMGKSIDTMSSLPKTTSRNSKWPKCSARMAWTIAGSRNILGN